MASKPTAIATRAKVQLPANIQASLAAQVADMQKRIGAPAGNGIKVTQKKTFRLPDGTESPGPFKAVILDFISGNYFYQGAFDPDDIAPPECFALGAEPSLLVPNDKVVSKQADSCSVCPQNQWGSADRGKGKACSNKRLLALLPLDATEDTAIMTLKISPTGIKQFDGYVGGVARSFGLPPVGVITTFSFDPANDYPSVRVGEPEALSADQVAFFASRQAEARQILMTPPDTQVIKVEKVARKGAGARRAA